MLTHIFRNPGITLLVLAGRLYLACLASLALTRQHLSGSTSNCLFLHVRFATMAPDFETAPIAYDWLWLLKRTCHSSSGLVAHVFEECLYSESG
nr:unnamed protein product [Spirometra erinaceieuropaei]